MWERDTKQVTKQIHDKFQVVINAMSGSKVGQVYRNDGERVFFSMVVKKDFVGITLAQSSESNEDMRRSLKKDWGREF